MGLQEPRRAFGSASLPGSVPASAEILPCEKEATEAPPTQGGHKQTFLLTCKSTAFPWGTSLLLVDVNLNQTFYLLFIIFIEKKLKKFFLLFICAYNVWVISPSFPHPLLPGRNYSALISNFVEERV
jgi:hypothetical protein